MKDIWGMPQRSRTLPSLYQTEYESAIEKLTRDLMESNGDIMRAKRDFMQFLRAFGLPTKPKGLWVGGMPCPSEPSDWWGMPQKTAVEPEPEEDFEMSGEEYFFVAAERVFGPYTKIQYTKNTEYNRCDCGFSRVSMVQLNYGSTPHPVKKLLRGHCGCCNICGALHVKFWDKQYK